MHRVGKSICRTVCKQHAQNDDRDQNDQLARKQRAERRADALVCGGERDCTSSTPCGQMYLQKYGSPMPTSLTMSAGSSTTASTMTMTKNSRIFKPTLRRLRSCLAKPRDHCSSSASVAVKNRSLSTFS